MHQEIDDILQEAGIAKNERTFQHEYLAEMVREARYDAEISWRDRNQMADALRKLRDKINGVIAKPDPNVKIYREAPKAATKQTDLNKDLNKAFDGLQRD